MYRNLALATALVLLLSLTTLLVETLPSSAAAEPKQVPSEESAKGNVAEVSTPRDNRQDADRLPEQNSLELTPGSTVRVSVDNNGIEAKGGSYGSTISSEGIVVFSTGASNWDDGPGVYARNFIEGITNALPFSPTQQCISDNGRFVVGTSFESDLVPGDTNGREDVFVYDMVDKVIERVSISSNGEQANDHSRHASISADGRFVVFSSEASNLVPEGSDTPNVYVYDRTNRTIEMVGVSSAGIPGNSGAVSAISCESISADGSRIVFSSNSTNLVDSDTNEHDDAFVRDIVAKKTILVSKSSLGTQGDSNSHAGSISADGNVVAFGSWASNLTEDEIYAQGQLFVHDIEKGETSLVCVPLEKDVILGQGFCNNWVSLSYDGNLVAFSEDDGVLIPNDTNNTTDAFVYNRTTKQITLVSVSTTGEQGNAPSFPSWISDNGKYVVFSSDASNLVSNDTNGKKDIFVHALPPTTYIVSGRVTDRNSSPIAGVTVSVGPGQETETQGDGTFELTLTPGVYTVTLAKDGYSFTPASQTNELAQDTTLGDFIGVADGGPVAPFLDLPFSYDGTLESFDRLMKNHSDEGQINSWFDHQYPKVWGQDGLWLYFESITDRPTAQTFDGFTIWGYRDNWWYSGHDALDIERAGLLDWFARSAAAGTVKVSGNVPSCNLGICVVIDHGNGYFTVYGHLAEVSVSAGDVVDRGEEIGTIGCTGICSAPHLHFAVYRDSVASPGWNNFADEKVVDPFGWSLEQPDPWVKDKGGPVSTYLWLHDIRPSDIIFDGAVGAELSDASQRVQVVIPAEYFAGQLSASLFPATVDRILMSLRPAGYSFRVKLLGQDAGEPNPLRALPGPEATTSGQIVISVDYSQSKLAHLDTSKLTLYRHDEESDNWLPLSTSVDTSQKLVQAETDVLGTFSLQAPLLCPSDIAEPDDVMFTAPLIDLGTEYFRVFDSLGDEDWFRWDTAAAQSVVVQTAELGTGVSTVIQVYDTEETLLATSESESAGVGAQFDWQAPDAGTYYIRVAPSATSSVGCAAEYKLTVQEQANNKFSIYLPSVTGGN